MSRTLGCFYMKTLLKKDVKILQHHLNNGVHDWLGKHWLIYLIMSKLSVSNQVNHNISVPGSSPFSSNFSNQHHSFWIISIHMENRSIDHTPYICTVRARPGVSWVCGEPYLVVSNNVDSAPNKEEWLL